MELSVKIEGKVLEKLRNAPATTQDEIRKAVNKASILLTERSIRDAPASTGQLRKSIRRELAQDGLSAQIFPTANYAYPLHGDGTKERSRPFTIPAREAQPGGSLYRWAQKKGANPWAVRHGISKRGIKHNPWLFKTSKKSESEIQDIFVKALNNIANHLAD